AFANMFKMSPEEIIGKSCYEILHGKNELLDTCPHKQVLETKKTSRAELFEPKLGIYQELSVSPIFDEAGEIIATVHISKDITERKKAEQQLQDAYQKLKETQQQLIQSSKMAAMGQLVAGVSHELNQPLTGIKGFAQAVLMDLEASSPLRLDLQKIVEQADRMDSIIKNLRLFARKSEFRKEELDINKPLQDSLMLLRQQLKVHNIQLTTHLEENLPKIIGDINQLQQVFLNLLTNARDAIDSSKRPTGGEIIVKTSLNKDKNSLEIIIQDTGCGIPKKNLDYIFNPFFTTKSTSGSMGLGLSIVYSIIEEHKGSIEVKSQEGKGTDFKIALPIAA
ncbi:MAG: ATP-binding protein, partial [Candidatus Omnitrophota bacterium]